MRMNMPIRCLVCRSLCVFLIAAVLNAVPLPPPQDDLTQMSLEDLMKVKVTSVSRKKQSFSKVGAAVYVISQDDIRRSGMTNIPDLLRLAPGVDVARIAANAWAISIRGFNDRYSTKVLVLIDGRSIYSQEFSGVWWDQNSVPLEDIDRIEVIRGPGGTVWGANAVNGTINIITKTTADTHGGIVSAATGSQDGARGFARYGGTIGGTGGDKGSYRVFGDYSNVEKSGLAGGGDAADGWHSTQGGFRTDLNLTGRDTLMVEGDVYRADEGQTITTLLPSAGFQSATFNSPIQADTTNLESRWNHTFANGSETSLQTFYSNLYRLDQATDKQNIYDLDFQYHFKMGGRNDLVSGIGYRHTALDYNGFYNYTYNLPELRSNLASTFVQDEIQLSNAVALTVGSKFEHNSFTGFEFEPSAQLVWAPSERRAVWFSAARAIRQPSWFYSNSILDAAAFPLAGGGLGVVRLLGSASSQAEQMIDFEAGYRTEISKRFSIDLTAFGSHYSQIATSEAASPFFEFSPAPPHLVLPSVWANEASARSYGLEMFGTWQVNKRWRLSPAYSFLQMKVQRDPNSTDPTVEGENGNSPKHQVRLRSTMDLPRRLEWDNTVFYVSGLNPVVAGFVSAPIASYARLDTRLGWRLGGFTELSFAAQNLLAPRRFEFSNTEQLHATPVQRSIIGKVTWRF
jgi:iron complex outermembrane receptor protein